MTQTNSRSIHTMPGIIVALPNWTLQELQGTASCPIPLPLTFIWGRGPADGVIGSLGKQSIPAQLSSWDGTAEAYWAVQSERAHCISCQRDREGTQHQAAAGSTVNLPGGLFCARVTPCTLLHARSFPHNMLSGIQICQAQQVRKLNLTVFGTYNQAGQEPLCAQYLMFCWLGPSQTSLFALKQSHQAQTTL